MLSVPSNCSSWVEPDKLSPMLMQQGTSTMFREEINFTNCQNLQENQSLNCFSSAISELSWGGQKASLPLSVFAQRKSQLSFLLLSVRPKHGCAEGVRGRQEGGGGGGNRITLSRYISSHATQSSALQRARHLQRLHPDLIQYSRERQRFLQNKMPVIISTQAQRWGQTTVITRWGRKWSSVEVGNRFFFVIFPFFLPPTLIKWYSTLQHMKKHTKKGINDYP